jgi:hypothetical protein
MKNFILPLIIGLVVGAGAGYLIYKNNNHGINFADSKNWTPEEKDAFKSFYKQNAFSFITPSSKPIGYTTAVKLIKEFQQENQDSGTPMMYYDQNGLGTNLLRGYFIESTYLKKIVDDPTNAGVSVYLAADSTANANGIVNVYTLVYTAAKTNTDYNPNKPEDDATNPMYLNPDANGTAYDFIQPCPTYCGNFVTASVNPNPAKK